jgi:Spy/CpxP family protein refolding chaperone
MSTKSRIVDNASALRRRLFKPAALVALLAIAATAGAGAMAHGAGAFGHHGGAAMTAEEMSAHLDMFLQHVYIEVEATPAQQAQLDPIVKQALADLMPLHTQMNAFHAKVLVALTADTVDRAALEALRVEHVQAADQASKRITQLVGDVADVLSPAQRKTLGARIAEHHGIAQ